MGDRSYVSSMFIKTSAVNDGEILTLDDLSILKDYFIEKYKGVNRLERLIAELKDGVVNCTFKFGQRQRVRVVDLLTEIH